MKKQFILIFILVISSWQLGFSQESLFAITYNMASPIANTADFVPAYSARGWGFEGRYALQENDNIAIGFSFSMNTFYKDMGNVTEQRDNITLEGKQYKYLNAIPLLVTAHYHHRPQNGDPVPYIGAGIGTSWIEETVDMGLYRVIDDNWHFTVAPEVGVIMPIGYETALFLSWKYVFSPKTKNSLSSHSWIGINVGLGYF